MTTETSESELRERKSTVEEVKSISMTRCFTHLFPLARHLCRRLGIHRDVVSLIPFSLNLLLL